MTDKITAERVGGHIKLPGPLPRSIKAKVESIRGAKFANPHWAFPLSLSSCYALREALGETLAVGPVLNAWARTEIDRQAALGELAEMRSVELSYVSDFIGAAMSTRTYQQIAAAFIADAGSCLIADQPGLGKTIELIAGLQEANPDAETRWHLILAPSIAVRAVWPDEVSHWAGEEAVAFPIRGTAAQRHEMLSDAIGDTSFIPPHHDVYVVCNLEMVRIKPWKNKKGKNEWHVKNKAAEGEPETGALYPELFDRVWDTIVVDESHRALIKQGKPTQVRSGLTKLRSQQRIALSGTPMRGKPHQLWGTLNWLRPDVFTSYWDWVAQYWDVYGTHFSSFNLGDFLPGGEDRLAADLRPYMLRRTKAEVLPELPAKLYAGTYLDPSDSESPHGVWLDMTPAAAKRYAEFVAEGTIELNDQWLIANGVLAERNRLIQLATSNGYIDNEVYFPAMPCPKFDWLVDFLDEVDGERVIVSSHSTKLLEMFYRELSKLKINSFLLTGNTNDRDRASMAASFQSDEPEASVFLLNAKAGGVALTLDMADYLVMLDESTIPDDDEQVEDRAHRTSRIHQLTVYKLRMLGTIEEEIAWVAAAAESVQKYILDGSRGVVYAREVYQQNRKSTVE